MCGILGVIGHRLPDRACVDAALERMRHRGPDDCGTWRDESAVLGSRRLAIIDLGHGGHQPMVSDSTRLTLVYNGEIYNHVELRQTLVALGHEFRSSSDTEVLLHAWEEWGPRCLGRLNGMWAFVVWDGHTKTAFFARDRFGVKPFYFTTTEEFLAIGSEPKVLLEVAPTLRRVDEAALYAFLAEGALYGHGRSFYDGIQVLPPGSCGRFRPGWRQPQVERWWTLPETKSEPDESQALDRFSETFEDAARIRLRGDVPVGVTLSGGLDSTAVLHAARRRLPPEKRLEAYTAVYSGGALPRGGLRDERLWAETAAEPYSSVDLHMVEPAHENWLETLRRIVWHMDGPGYSPAVLPLWHISSVARAQGVPVLLDGQGADELLGGYARHVALALLDAAADILSERRLASLGRFKEVLKVGTTSFPARTFGLEVAAQTLPAVRQRYLARQGALSVLRREWVESVAPTAQALAPQHRYETTSVGSRLEQALRSDLTEQVLPGFLHYGDAITMAHSVEARMPFLDFRLVELCLELPTRLKLNGGGTKGILRDYLRRVGQDRIAGRQDKRGFPTPMSRWLAEENGALARELLLAPDAMVGEYAMRSSLGRLIDRHVSGQVGFGDHLYRLVTTELWLQECLRRPRTQ